MEPFVRPLVRRGDQVLVEDCCNCKACQPFKGQVATVTSTEEEEGSLLKGLIRLKMDTARTLCCFQLSKVVLIHPVGYGPKDASSKDILNSRLKELRDASERVERLQSDYTALNAAALATQRNLEEARSGLQRLTDAFTKDLRKGQYLE